MSAIKPNVDYECLLVTSPSTVLAEAASNARTLEEIRFLQDGGISDSYRAECELANVRVGYE